MSVRLTKKSLVNWPDAVGEHAVRGAAMVGAQHPHAAEQHGHLRRGQAHQLGAVEQHFLRFDHVLLLLPVAEAIGQRLQRLEGFGIGHLLGGIAAARWKGTCTSWPAALAACSIPTIAPQHDDIGDAGAGVGGDRLVDLQHLGQALRLVAGPVLLRGQADAGPVGAAAHVGAAEGAGAVPGGADHLVDAQAASAIFCLTASM